jgi:hypothetical protein
MNRFKLFVGHWKLLREDAKKIPCHGGMVVVTICGIVSGGLGVIVEHMI